MAPCPTHPDAEAVGACDRCGRFFCLPERVALDGKRYCGECGARDDVDWLGKHYRKFEGKRSGLAWFLVLVGVLLGALGLVLAVSPGAGGKERSAGLALSLFAASCFASASGREGLRLAVLVGALLLALAFALISDRPFAGLVLGVPGLALGIATWSDLRTRLFYRVPVPREQLLKHFLRLGNNPLAVLSSRLAFLGLFVPGLGLVSLVLAVLALTKVSAKKVPPVAGVRIALGALVFSLFTLFIWVAVLLPSFARR